MIVRRRPHRFVACQVAEQGITPDHSEIRHWKDARTMPPIVKDKTFTPPNGNLIMPQPSNRDIIWLQEHATRKL